MKRKEPPDLFLRELRELLSLHGQNWTGPYDRGYQYEFFIATGRREVSLIVEISAIVAVAAVVYGYQDNGKVESIRCSDDPENVDHREYKEVAASFLREHGYEILPIDTWDARHGDKTLKELLIYDCED